MNPVFWTNVKTAAGHVAVAVMLAVAAGGGPRELIAQEQGKQPANGAARLGGVAGDVGPTGSKAPEVAPPVEENRLKVIEVSEPGALKESGAKYVLQKDLTVPGTAFSVGTGVTDVVLDLNGHAVVYNDERATEVPGEPYGHCVYGVTIGGRSVASVVVRNGFIIQGKGSNSGCHAIHIRVVKAIEICNLQTRVHGPSCSNVAAVWAGPDGRVHDNFMENRSRDIAAGLHAPTGVSVLHSGKNWEIYGNTIIGGHAAIYVGANALNDHRIDYAIHHNFLRPVRVEGHKTPQGICCFGAAGIRIYENVISTDEARGINIQATGSGWCDVHHNLVACRYSTEARQGNYVENRCYGYWERNCERNRVHGNIFVVDNEVEGDATSSTVGILATTPGDDVRLPSAEFSNNRVICHHKDPQAPVLGIEVKRSDKDVVLRANEIYARTAAIEVGSHSSGVWVEGNVLIKPPAAASWAGIGGVCASECRAEKNVTVDFSPDQDAPAEPNGLRAISRKEAVELRWEIVAQPNVRGYNIYRDGKRLNALLCGGCFYLDLGVQPGSKHAYAVSAVDLSGNEGPCGKAVEGDSLP